MTNSFSGESTPWPGGEPVQVPQVNPVPVEVNATIPLAGADLTVDVAEVEPIIDENSEPGVVRSYLQGLDRSDAIRFAAGVGTVALIVGGWIAKKRLVDVKTSDGDRVFISSDIPHAKSIVSVGELVMNGLAVSLPKGREAAEKLRSQAKDVELNKKDPVSKHLFAMLKKRGIVHPLEEKSDESAYSETVETVVGWLDAALDRVRPVEPEKKHLLRRPRPKHRNRV